MEAMGTANLEADGELEYDGEDEFDKFLKDQGVFNPGEQGGNSIDICTWLAYYLKP